MAMRMKSSNNDRPEIDIKKLFLVNVDLMRNEEAILRVSLLDRLPLNNAQKEIQSGKIAATVSELGLPELLKIREERFYRSLQNITPREKAALKTELETWDRSGLSIAFILKSLGLSQILEWLKANGLLFYSPTDAKIAKLIANTTPEEFVPPTNNLFELAVLYFPNEHKTLYEDPEPEYVYVKRLGSEEPEKMAIAAFKRLANIASFKSVIRYPKGLDSFLPIEPVETTASTNDPTAWKDHLYFEENPPPVGWIVKVLGPNPLPANMSFPYCGLIAPMEGGAYCAANGAYGKEYTHVIDAKDNKSISSLFPHLPSVDELKNLIGHPYFMGKIVTASLENSITIINGYSALTKQTNNKLPAEAVVGFDYGETYFPNLGIVPRYFDQDFGIIPIPLCHPLTTRLVVQVGDRVVKITNNLDYFWNKIRENQSIIITAEDTTVEIRPEQIRAALLEMHAFPKIPNNYLQSDFDPRLALKEAVIEGDFDKVWYLIEFYQPQIDINSVIDDESGRTALHYALIHNRWDIAIFLIADGANPLLKDFSENNCLAYTAVKESLTDIILATKFLTRCSDYDQRKIAQQKVAQSIPGLAAEIGVFGQTHSDSNLTQATTKKSQKSTGPATSNTLGR